MPVNRPAFHGIDNTIDGDLVIHQVGKGGSITEFEIGNLARIQSKLLEAVIGKIAGTVFSFRIDVVNIVRMANCRSVFPDNRRLTHTEGIDKHPSRHSQGCKNPAHLQLFGFGTRLFAAPLIAVISVCHMQIPLFVYLFSICSSSWLSRGKSSVIRGSCPCWELSPGRTP